MRALILDTETTGLDPAAGARCIEVGCILYDLGRACPVVSYSSLIAGLPTNEAQAVNGIPPDILSEAPLAPNVWAKVASLVRLADVVLAHRAEFDAKFVPPEVRVLRPFVCTKFHVAWPRGRYGEHLVQLALEHGLGVASAHRALTDCDTISRLLTRVAELHPLPALIQHAMRPRVKVLALTKYEEREATKAAGFTWAPEVKEWTRECFEDEVAAIPFATRVVGPVAPIGGPVRA